MFFNHTAMSVVENILKIKNELPQGVTLVAVSKTYPAENIREAYNAGQRIFGENKPQEMTAKHAELPDDLQWHMIGNLQTNKVIMIIPYVSMIESVSSSKLLQTIDKEAARINRKVDILFEIHIAEEDSKMGWNREDFFDYIESEQWRELKNICPRGVMGMATFTDDNEVVRREFKSLSNIFNQLKEKYFAKNDEFDTISMGMSGDWRLAIEQGSTQIRVGSAIFGARNYDK